MISFFFLIACNTPKVDSPTSNTVDESSQKQDISQSCIDTCVHTRQMEARDMEDIKRDCMKSCNPNQKTPTLEGLKVK